MSERVYIPDSNIDIRYEETRVKCYRRGNNILAKVDKAVPPDWSGKTVVILLKEDFDKIVNMLREVKYENTRLRIVLKFLIEAVKDGLSTAYVKFIKMGIDPVKAQPIIRLGNVKDLKK